MRRWMMLLLLMAGTTCGMAQWLRTPQQVVALRGGLSGSDLAFSHEGYDLYAHTPLLRPWGGVLYRYRVRGALSLRADALWTQRGSTLQWCDVDYELRVQQVELRPLLQCNIGQSGQQLSPYVAAGLYFALPTGGTIDYTSQLHSHQRYDLTRTALRPFDLGAYVGLGLELPFTIGYQDFLLLAEVGYATGLINNFSHSELNGEAVVMNPEFDIDRHHGSRRHRAVEASIGLALPLYKAKPKAEDEEEQLLYDADYVAVDSLMQRSKSGSTHGARRPRSYSDAARPWQGGGCISVEEALQRATRGISVANESICPYEVHFAFNSYEVNLGGRDRLRRTAELLQREPSLVVEIDGHTDAIGSDSYNDRLSIQRVGEVSYYLCTVYGIDPSRVIIHGYGEHRPVANNATDDGRRRNRRVEVRIYGK